MWIYLQIHNTMILFLAVPLFTSQEVSRVKSSFSIVAMGLFTFPQAERKSDLHPKKIGIKKTSEFSF